MTLAIIDRFYDKFLSLKNEPKINRKTFCTRILLIGFYCFLSYIFMLITLGVCEEIIDPVVQPVILGFLSTMLLSIIVGFWLVYSVNITIVKRIQDIGSNMVYNTTILYQYITLMWLSGFYISVYKDTYSLFVPWELMFSGGYYLVQILLIITLSLIPSWKSLGSSNKNLSAQNLHHNHKNAYILMTICALAIFTFAIWQLREYGWYY